MSTSCSGELKNILSSGFFGGSVVKRKQWKFYFTLYFEQLIEKTQYIFMAGLFGPMTTHDKIN